MFTKIIANILISTILLLPCNQVLATQNSNINPSILYQTNNNSNDSDEIYKILSDYFDCDESECTITGSSDYIDSSAVTFSVNTEKYSTVSGIIEYKTDETGHITEVNLSGVSVYGKIKADFSYNASDKNNNTTNQCNLKNNETGSEIKKSVVRNNDGGSVETTSITDSDESKTSILISSNPEANPVTLVLLGQTNESNGLLLYQTSDVIKIFDVKNEKSVYNKTIGKAFKTTNKRLTERDIDDIMNKLISEDKIELVETVSGNTLPDYISVSEIMQGKDYTNPIRQSYMDFIKSNITKSQPTNQSTNNTTSSGSSGVSGRSSGIMPPHTRFWHLRNIDMVQ